MSTPGYGVRARIVKIQTGYVGSVIMKDHPKHANKED